jgi:hypothetical protein
MDLSDIEDETPRSSQNDWHHWSSWSLNVTSATLTPDSTLLTGKNAADPTLPETHDFLVEAEDINGLRSLGWVHFLVVPLRSDKNLLIVKDTRLDVDYRQSSWPPDSVGQPTGNWPTTAELDTFLFAVGGVRWKSTPSTGYYRGVSPPGIFKGYSYDTIGTRKGMAVPTQWISLDTLSHYRNVIWISSNLANSGWDQTMGNHPTSTLRYMSAPNRQNMLSTWVKQGGQLWALGGAFGEATNTGTVPTGWNRTENDQATRTYSYLDLYKDLRPGRFMYDLSHWQSEFRTASGIVYRVARLDQRNPTSGYPPPKGDWLGEPLRDPRYLALPTLLKAKDPTTDPLWPNRTTTNFYLNNPTYGANGIDLEFISAENRITEMQGDPDHPTEVSVLDTLYLAYGAAGHVMLNPQNGEGVNPCMTYYHGSENPPMVFSGFDLWHWRRQDCVAVVDFVLGQMWGMSRAALVAGAQPSRALIRPMAAPAGQRSIQRPVLKPFGGAAQRPPVTSTLKRLH